MVINLLRTVMEKVENMKEKIGNVSKGVETLRKKIKSES